MDGDSHQTAERHPAREQTGDSCRTQRSVLIWVPPSFRILRRTLQLYRGSFAFLSQSTCEPGRGSPPRSTRARRRPSQRGGSPGGALGDPRSEPGRAEGTTCAHGSVLRTPDRPQRLTSGGRKISHPCSGVLSCRLHTRVSASVWTHQAAAQDLPSDLHASSRDPPWGAEGGAQWAVRTRPSCCGCLGGRPEHDTKPQARSGAGPAVCNAAGRRAHTSPWGTASYKPAGSPGRP